MLREMFSPIGGPKDDGSEEIDWAGDLKAYIDDHEELLSKEIMPAVSKHQKHLGHPRAYKLYIRPIKKCIGVYCDEFDLDRSSIFTPAQIIKLAKLFAKTQSEFIKKGDYDAS